MMSSNQSDIARALLLAEGVDATSSPAELAQGVEQVWMKLRAHFTRLIGDAGIQAVLDRTIRITAARSTWLPLPVGADREAALRAAFENQSVEVGVQGFADLLWTFIGLLGRFIGDQLVERLLREIWPDVFASVLKELP